jgi:hypothetical protein
VALCIEMGDRVVMDKRRWIFLGGIGAACRSRRGGRALRCPRPRIFRSVPAVRVETRRRTAEWASPLTQSARGPGAHVGSLVAAVTTHGMLTRARGAVRVLIDMDAIVPVVPGPFGAVAEDLICRGDGREARRRVGIGSVTVWVVGER